MLHFHVCDIMLPKYLSPGIEQFQISHNNLFLRIFSLRGDKNDKPPFVTLNVSGCNKILQVQITEHLSTSVKKALKFMFKMI